MINLIVSLLQSIYIAAALLASSSTGYVGLGCVDWCRGWLDGIYYWRDLCSVACAEEGYDDIVRSGWFRIG